MNGRLVFRECARLGLEGVVAKRRASLYRPGVRTPDWVKISVRHRDEFVVGGYLARHPGHLGGLIVGQYDRGGRLRYAGKVGTGYTAATLRHLGARLRALETPESPFVDARPIPRGTHWTRPELVAQIGFAEWTGDGRLRQPRFLGLRDDKAPAEVVRERPR